MNLKQLYTYIGTIVEGIPTVHSFYTNDIYEAWNGGDVKYGSVVFAVKNVNTTNSTTVFDVIIYYGDRINEMKSNVDAVQTDGVNVIQAIVGNINNDEETISVNFPVQLTLFEQKFADELAGAYAEFNITTEGMGECVFNQYYKPVNPDDFYTKEEVDLKLANYAVKSVVNTQFSEVNDRINGIKNTTDNEINKLSNKVDDNYDKTGKALNQLASDVQAEFDETNKKIDKNSKQINDRVTNLDISVDNRIDNSIAASERRTYDVLKTKQDISKAVGTKTVLGGEIFNNANNASRNAHAEGFITEATGDASHAEGEGTKATGSRAHAEGWYTVAEGSDSHAEGWYSKSKQGGSHAEGSETSTYGGNSHAEGDKTTTLGKASHNEGFSSNQADSVVQVNTVTNYETYKNAWDVKKYSLSHGEASHVEGKDNMSFGNYSHSEGLENINRGSCSHSEGYSNFIESNSSHAEGEHNQAKGLRSHVEGNYNITTGDASHAEGTGCQANGVNSHAEGEHTLAHYINSHSEGYHTINYGESAHVEGFQVAIADKSWGASRGAHAEGFSSNEPKPIFDQLGLKWENMEPQDAINAYNNTPFSIALGEASHVEGKDCMAIGDNTHAEGVGNIAKGYGEHACGMYNQSHDSSLMSVGCGWGNTYRWNAFEIDNQGKIYVRGLGTYDGTNPQPGKNDLVTLLKAIGVPIN